MRSMRTWIGAVGCATVTMAAVLTPTTSHARPPDCQVENLDTGQDFTPNLQHAIDVVATGQTIQVKGICRGNFATGSFAQPVKQFTIVGKARRGQPIATLDGGTTGRTLFFLNANVTLRSLALTGGDCLEGTNCAGHMAFISAPPFGVRFVELTDVTIGPKTSTTSTTNAVHIAGPTLFDRVTIQDVAQVAVVLRDDATIRDSTFTGNLVALLRVASDPGTITFDGLNTFRDNQTGIRQSGSNLVGQPPDLAIGVGATLVFEDNAMDCDPGGLLPGLC